MKKLLQDKRNKLLEQAKAITVAAGENFTVEQAAEVEKLTAQASALKKQISALDGLDAEQAASSDLLPRISEPSNPETATVNTASISTHDRVLDDPTCGYGSKPGAFGTFAADVRAMADGNPSENLRILAAAGDGLSAGIKQSGGVLLPPAFSKTIQDKMGQASNNLLAEVDMLPPLPEGVESMEYPAVDESSRANGSRQGGLQGYWKGELSAMSESKPKLKGVKFEPSELYVFAFASDKLLRNAPQLESWLTDRAVDEINFKLGDAVINGTGTAQPRGILTGATDAPRVQISKETGQAAATIVKANIDKMYARMPARYLSGAKWYVNVDIYPQLLQLSAAVGTGGMPIFLPGGNIASAPFGTIYGLPIVPTEYNATLGTEGDIILANMKAYGFQTRGTVQTGMSIHLKFDYNQTAFRFIFEADGQPWISSALTPFKGSNKQSPFVTLATRS